jgi:hypothetical protein
MTPLHLTMGMDDKSDIVELLLLLKRGVDIRTMQNRQSYMPLQRQVKPGKWVLRCWI